MLFQTIDNNEIFITRTPGDFVINSAVKRFVAG